MRILLSVFSLMFFLTVNSFSQAPVDYRDVGLIVNVDDSNSVAIAAYFVQQRDFPDRNIIRVSAPAKETITPVEFDDMRAQIEEYLTVTTGLADSLNYFVTTKGVPLRVIHNSSGGDRQNASVDAELMLILGRFAPHIHQNSLFASETSIRVHPYYGRNESYKRTRIVPGTNPPAAYDMFLTTRLTGLTRGDVFALIDRSGPFTFVDKDSALWVFDRDPRPIQLNPYDLNLANAGNYLLQRGWNVLLNEDSVFVTDQRNVLGYGSWGSNDHFDHHFSTRARPRNHWLPGSVAETYVSTSARNFTPGKESGQSRIADLIAEGCTGASGYVFEPYTVALTWVNMLAERYTNGHNLADSYYMSSPTFSWMAVIVGDPKTTIITEIPDIPTPTIKAVENVCTGSTVNLTAEQVVDGNMHWFAGDSLTVLGTTEVLDEHHPLWIGDGSSTQVLLDTPGEHVYTFVNENFIGKGFAEARIEAVSAPEVTLTVSADTVFLSDGAVVEFTAIADGAIAWAWSFGDGATGNGEHISHVYTRTGSFAVSVLVSNGTCVTTVRHTIVVLQVNSAGNIPTIASRISLGTGYPNPTASVTAIPFSLPTRMHVRLRIFDALGRLVATLADEEFDSGTHTVLWQPEAELSGSVHCVLEAGLERRTQRISIIR
ncbi:MAG: TIGR03790 family protein [Bacteroidetes bacterium]|nr:TIGR03790 family protein [Bacteroidota bacterium]